MASSTSSAGAPCRRRPSRSAPSDRHRRRRRVSVIVSTTATSMTSSAVHRLRPVRHPRPARRQFRAVGFGLPRRLWVLTHRLRPIPSSSRIPVVYRYRRPRRIPYRCPVPILPQARRPRRLRGWNVDSRFPRLVDVGAGGELPCRTPPRAVSRSDSSISYMPSSTSPASKSPSSSSVSSSLSSDSDADGNEARRRPRSLSRHCRARPPAVVGTVGFIGVVRLGVGFGCLGLESRIDIGSRGIVTRRRSAAEPECVCPRGRPQPCRFRRSSPTGAVASSSGSGSALASSASVSTPSGR